MVLVYDDDDGTIGVGDQSNDHPTASKNQPAASNTTKLKYDASHRLFLTTNIRNNPKRRYKDLVRLFKNTVVVVVVVVQVHLEQEDRGRTAKGDGERQDSDRQHRHGHGQDQDLRLEGQGGLDEQGEGWKKICCLRRYGTPCDVY